jgi:hypothetical protein
MSGECTLSRASQAAIKDGISTWRATYCEIEVYSVRIRLPSELPGKWASMNSAALCVTLIPGQSEPIILTLPTKRVSSSSVAWPSSCCILVRREFYSRPCHKFIKSVVIENEGG